MDKLIAGKTISVTEEGFMTEFSQWDKSIADAIAAENDVTLLSQTLGSDRLYPDRIQK
jgi:sulfur relay (sulfurtransferase) DsrC/TusE family protein